MAVSPRRRAMMAELAAWHDEWEARHLPDADAQFHPEGRREGSDYNQHYLDVDVTPTQDDEYQAGVEAILARYRGADAT